MAKKKSDVVAKDLLVTASLLSSVDFYLNQKIGSEWKSKALVDLKGTLSRAPWSGGSKFTERGNAFESKLIAFIKSLNEKKFYEVMAPDCICEPEKLKPFYDLCKGGDTQKELKTKIEIDGQSYCLYGKADVWFPERIVDIKTTSSWVDKGKFLATDKYTKSAQHLIYNHINKTSDFKYIAAEFVELPREHTNSPIVWKIIDVHVVDTSTPDLAAVEKEIRKRITFMVDYLKSDTELWSNYCNVFTRF